MIRQMLFVLILSSLSMTVYGHSIRFAGIWEGDAQYQLVQDNGDVTDTHAVPLFVFHVGPHGEIAGDSEQNGCRFSGAATPDGTQPSMTIQITLSGCNIAAYNGRYDGQFVYDMDVKNANVILRMAAGSTETGEIRATVIPL